MKRAPLPRWHLVEPSPLAAFFVGLFLCGPLAIIVYIILLALGRG